MVVGEETSGWARALDPGVALDGWAGAALGALASVAVALLVVHLTRRHDRAMLQDQIVAQRNDVFDQRRREAFSEVLAALDAFELVPVATKDRVVLQDRIKASTYGWMLYMTDIELAEAVQRGCEEAIRTAARNLVEHGEMMTARGVEKFSAPDVRNIRNTLLDHGRVWHTDPMRRDEARAALLAAFPPSASDGA